MSSGVPVLGRTKDATRKTYINSLYNYSMGGVDDVDKMLASMSCRFKSDRWPINTRKYFICNFKGQSNKICNPQSRSRSSLTKFDEKKS